MCRGFLGECLEWLWKRPAHRTRLELRTVPVEALLTPQRAVSKKPCRGVWNRNKGVIIATSYSMQVASGDRVKACKSFCLT